MLRDLRQLLDHLGRRPPKTEMDANLNFRTRHVEKEFGSIASACDEAEKIQPMNPRLLLDRPNDHGQPFLRSASARRRYGSPINFKGLRHAPMNELGVVFLFGMLCEQLGFVVESIQSGFPDGAAKRRLRDGTYEELRIELEFASSSFRRHGHDPDKCDLIVCWRHDWPECPLEVIELRTVISESA